MQITVGSYAVCGSSYILQGIDNLYVVSLTYYPGRSDLVEAKIKACGESGKIELDDDYIFIFPKTEYGFKAANYLVSGLEKTADKEFVESDEVLHHTSVDVLEFTLNELIDDFYTITIVGSKHSLDRYKITIGDSTVGNYVAVGNTLKSCVHNLNTVSRKKEVKKGWYRHPESPVYDSAGDYRTDFLDEKHSHPYREPFDMDVIIKSLSSFIDKNLALAFVGAAYEVAYPVDPRFEIVHELRDYEFKLHLGASHISSGKFTSLTEAIESLIYIFLQEINHHRYYSISNLILQYEESMKRKSSTWKKS